MIETMFLSVLQVSISLGIILLLLYLTSSLLEAHLSPVIRRILWILLSLRLLIPVQHPFPVRSLHFSFSDTAFSGVTISSAFPAQWQDNAGTVNASTALPQQMQHASFFQLSPLSLFTLLWVAGIFVFALYELLAYYQIYRLLFRWGLPPQREQTTSLFQRLTAELGIKHCPKILIHARVQTPMAVGFLRPAVLLPHENYPEQELRFILRHELTHIKQRDIWLRLLLLAANALHWFNPLVYRMRHTACADMEFVCDNLVLAGDTFEQRRAYSETILSSIKTKNNRRRSLTTQIYGGVHAMKKRIRNILEPVPPCRGIGAASVILLCTVFLGSLIACTSHTLPQRIDVGFDMGSLFDYAEISKKSVGVRGLSPEMTAEDVIDYYGLAAEDFTIRDSEAKPIPNMESVKLSYCLLDQCAFFDETGDIPCSVSFDFSEAGTLRGVGFSVRYLGVPWEDAHKNAMSLFETINQKAGKAITQEEWMQTPDYRGMVYNDFADPVDSLSEFGSHFMRQYMYMGSASNQSFTVSMSYQDFSEADTTKTLGQDYDEIFEFSLTILVR